ncbi:MAG: hypothetical protein ASARMPRED_005019 [Alectoria sarmentosa]|nr:MAG: hypothetical protein ASARMPRED_005019 [Alectoria sarmentosa]
MLEDIEGLRSAIIPSEAITLDDDSLEYEENFGDSDFDEDTKGLPPARPDSEPTDILFYIAKHMLMAVFEKVLRLSLSTATNIPLMLMTSILKSETHIRLSQKTYAYD